MSKRLPDHIRPYKVMYWKQRDSAKQRGVEWAITFEEWFEWWGNDIVNRGHKKGQLVMARLNDVGPYAVDNIKKITCSENVKEARSRDAGKPAWNRGMPGFMLGRKLTEEQKLKQAAGIKRAREANKKLKEQLL